MTTELGGLAWNAVSDALSAIRDRIQSGSAPRRSNAYERFKVKRFAFKEGGVECEGSYEDVLVDEWDSADMSRLLEETIKPSASFRALQEGVARLSSPEDAESRLSFAFWIILQRHEEFVGDAAVAGLVTVLVDDLLGNAVPFDVDVDLDGVWTEKLRVEIASDAVLRQPSPSDLEILAPKFPQRPDRGRSGSAILETRLMGRAAMDVEKHVNQIVDCLQLFRVGSVQSFGQRAKPHTPFMGGGEGRWDFGRPTVFKYSVSPEDAEDLAEFVRVMRPLVPVSVVLGGGFNAESPVEIALSRYRDGLLARGPNEARITWAITALEALFLRAEERTELKRRLSQRTAVLLAEFGAPSLKISNEIARAYDIRSEYIHGAVGGKVDREKLQGQGRALLDCARLAIVLHLQLGGVVEKDVLIGRLDNALLDGGARKKLTELLAEHTCVPERARRS